MALHTEKSAFIQSDWEESAEPGASCSKFFFGRREHGEKNKHFKAEINKTGDVELQAEDGISLTIHQKTAKMRFPDFETTFIAPLVKISNPYKRTSLKSLDVSCTGNLLVFTDSDGHLSVLNSKTGAEMRSFEDHIMDVYQARFFPSGLVVLSAGMDMTVRVWSVELNHCARTFKGHTQAVTAVAILDVGKEVLSCSRDGTAIKWSNPEDKILKKWAFEAGPCTAICIGVDHISSWFAVACEGRKVFVEDANESEICSFSTDEVPTALAFDSFSSEQILYVGDEAGGVLAFNIQKKEVVYRLKTARRSVSRILPHQKGILASYYDGTVALYRRDFGIDHPSLEFTGSDIDPIYDMCLHEDTLYTASRDNCIRKYTIPEI